MVHDRQFPAMAGNAACLQIFPDRPAPARALVAKPFESTLAAQGPTDLQEIGGASKGVWYGATARMDQGWKRRSGRRMANRCTGHSEADPSRYMGCNRPCSTGKHPVDLGSDRGFQQRDFVRGQVEQAIDDAVDLGFGLGDLG